MPQDPNDKTKVLYDAVSKDYDIGTYDEFTSKLSDPTKREAFFKGVGAEYDLGDYETFSKKLGYDSKEVKQNLPFVKTAQETLSQAITTQDPVQQSGQPLNKAGKPIGVKPKPSQDQPDIKEAIDNSVNEYFATNYNKTYKPTEREKELQRENVIQEYKKGNLVPKKTADGTTKMKRGTGFLESLNESMWTVHNRNLKDKWFASLPKEEAIKYLNLEAENPGLIFGKESENAPSGVGGHVGEFLGENAEILAKGTTGAVAGASTPYTGAAGFGTFMATLDDVAKGAYSQTLRNNYTALKNQYPEMTDEEAFDKASNSAVVAEGVGIGTNALLSHSIAPTLKPTVPVTGVIDGIKRSFVHSLEAAPKVLGSAAAGSVANDATAKAIGLDVSLEDVFKHASEATKEMAIMHFGLNALTEPSRIPSYIRPQIERVVASAPREGVREFYQNAEAEGKMPEGTTDAMMNKLAKVDKANAVVENMPITEEKKAAIAGKLMQRDNLIAQKEALSKYGASFNDQVAKIDERIVNTENEINLMHKAEDVFQFETDALTGESLSNHKPFEELTTREKQGIVIPKEYGEASVKEVGEGENKTYKPVATYIEKNGALEVSKPIKIEDAKTYTSKEAAQKAADEALAGKYYEEVLPNNQKPQSKKQSEPVGEQPVSSVEKEITTPEGFQNRIHDGGIVLGNPNESSHVTQSDYTYRSLGEGEIQAIAETGGVYARDGKQKGGNSNVKYWSRGNDKFFYKPNQNVIRVKNENISESKVVKASDLEIWDKQKNEFVPFVKEVKNETKTQTEKPIQQTMEGSGTGNEPITAEKTSVTESIIPETTRPNGEEQSAPEKPEIIKLNEERSMAVKGATKESAKLNLIPSKELVKAKEPIAAKAKHDEIVSKYKSLRKLIDCI